MNFLYVYPAIGLFTSLLIIISAFVQKKINNRQQIGIAGMIVIAGYIFGHYLLSGLPPIFQSGMNLSTEHWNFIIAIASIIPVILYNIKNNNNFIILAVRGFFLLSLFTIVLQVPYIQSTWPFWKSLIVVSLAAIIALIFWSEMDRINEDYSSGVVLFMLLNLSLTVSVILLLSGTFTISMLCGAVTASISAITILYFLLPGFHITFPFINMKEASCIVLIMTVFFITEGYFFANVPLLSILFYGIALISPHIITFFVSLNKLSEKKKKPYTLILSSAFSIIAIIIAGLTNI